MSKKHEAKEVVETPKHAVAAVNAPPIDAGSWGMDQELTAQDILIPRVLPMQPASKLVMAEEAKFGELRNSVTKEIMGDLKTPLEFIPFYMQKTFVVMRKDKKAAKFVKEIPITPDIENHPYENPTEGGIEFWYRNYNFYVLRPGDIKADKSMPFVLSFRSSSARAGKNLATQMFTMNLRAKKSPAAQVMKVTPKKTTNDDGTFVVLEVEPVRDSSDIEVRDAYNWVQIVRSGKIKVDEAAEDTEVVAAEEASPAGADKF